MKQTNQLDKYQVQRNFNRYAASYDAHAAIYQAVNQSLLERLQLIKLKPLKILELGCGTGELSQKLVELYPKAEIFAIDNSVEMLDLANKRSKQVNFLLMDAECLALAGQRFDLIVSNLMLPWCNDLASVFQIVQQLLLPEGLFMFTTFGPDTLQELRQAWAAVDSAAHVHCFLDMHDVGDRLLAAGLTDPVMDVEYIHLFYSSVEAALTELKQSGVTNALRERAKGLLSRAKYQHFVEQLRQQFDDSGKLPITYEVIHGHAWHGEPLAPAGDEFTISLENLRRQLL